MDHGPVEKAIRTAIARGQVLETPTQGKPFTVEEIDSKGVVLLLGEGSTLGLRSTKFSLSVLRETLRSSFVTGKRQGISANGLTAPHRPLATGTQVGLRPPRFGTTSGLVIHLILMPAVRV
ncbi:MAG TPA: hypothetical protein VM848_04600 [Acidimicrobiia bacterium]|nr:hypothetical protein [Acidimicrobiia bacterium]